MTRLPRPLYIVWRVVEMLAQIVSRFINAAFFGGSTRQTLSARAFIEQWPRGRARIDAFFALFGWPDHCREAWDAEVRDAIATLDKNQVIEPHP